MVYTFCVDFDGTIVTHEYPKIGQPVPYALQILRELQVEHNIILYTMRSGESLLYAMNYLRENGIDLYGINSNPTQSGWTTSPKVYGNFYIDDAAIGCPLVFGHHKRPYVDWVKIREILVGVYNINLGVL